ncbi:MAG: DUF2335 domain-containing protein [Cyanobacteria bacterium J06639_14]
MSELTSESQDALNRDDFVQEQGNGKQERRIEVTAASLNFSGPLPPPQILAQYNNAHPDAADRILKMAEREQQHRHETQSKMVETHISDLKAARHEKRLGQILGFTIGAICIFAGLTAVLADHPVSGTIFGSTGVVGLVSVFVAGRQINKENDDSEISEALMPSAGTPPEDDEEEIPSREEVS